MLLYSLHISYPHVSCLRVAALNQSLARTVAGGSEEDNEEDQMLDDIPMADGSQGCESPLSRDSRNNKVAAVC